MEDEKKEEIKPEVKEEIKVPDIVQQANAAAATLKEMNERMEKNLKELKELKAYDALGGKSDGAKQLEVPKEVSDKDYAKMALAGKIKK